MAQLIDHLADLAGQRDRDKIDRWFLALLDDLLAPASIALLQPQGDLSSPTWSAVGWRGPWGGSGSGPGLLEVGPTPLYQLCLADDEITPWTGTPERLLLPMRNDREVVAVLDVHLDREPDSESLRVLRSLQRFYGHVRGLIDENDRDALTGLLNRKSFDETFVHAATTGVGAPEANEGRCHVLAVVDIDHFKRVNDTHGHLIGDEALLLVAHLMRSTFRHHDRLYRFGGEEFVVLLQNVPSESVLTLLERLRLRVAEHEFPRIGHITVSIGYTLVTAADTPTSAFERADRCVYHAKSAGRNATFGYEALVERGDIEPVEVAEEVDFF